MYRILQVFAWLILISSFYLYLSTNVKAQVVINEFQIEPDNWIELYNKSDGVFDISGWIIDDEGGSQKYTISSNTILNSKKCISFQSGNFNWDSSSSDDIKLFDSQTNLVELYHYDVSPGDNISIGREIDGEGLLVVLLNNSRDRLNLNDGSCLQPTPTPSPTPTQTATPQPTQTSTPTQTAIPTIKSTPAKTATPKPSSTPTEEPTNEPEESDNLLSLASVSETSTPKTEVLGDKTTSKTPTLALLFILFGIAFLGYGGYLIYNRSKENNPTHENSNSV